MSFLKKMFNKSEPEVRKLSKASELMANDMVTLTDSFALPEILRGQQFQVKAVNSYEFEHHTQTEWVLSGHSGTDIYLSLDQDDDILLKFSIKLSHSDVESLFDLDQFAMIFEEEPAFLEKQQDTSLSNGWSSDAYEQSGFIKVGYFHRKDFRSESDTPSQYEGSDSGEQFELFTLYDEDGSKGIDVEVWQDGETDVFLVLYRPESDIIDFFPGS